MKYILGKNSNTIGISQGKIEKFIRDNFSHKFRSKKIIWTKYIRIHTDGGWPVMYYLPKYRRIFNNKYWNMHGFVINWLGREWFFSFGEDINNFYKTYL